MNTSATTSAKFMSFTKIISAGIVYFGVYSLYKRSRERENRRSKCETMETDDNFKALGAF
jgi:hypothetical protein